MSRRSASRVSWSIVISTLNTMLNQIANDSFNNDLFNEGTIVTMAKTHEQGERLRLAARELAGLTGITEIGNSIDESPHVVSNWMRRGISFRGALKIARELGCSAEWLLYGEGAMSEWSPAMSKVISALAKIDRMGDPTRAEVADLFARFLKPYEISDNSTKDRVHPDKKAANKGQ